MGTKLFTQKVKEINKLYVNGATTAHLEVVNSTHSGLFQMQRLSHKHLAE